MGGAHTTSHRTTASRGTATSQDLPSISFFLFFLFFVFFLFFLFVYPHTQPESKSQSQSKSRSQTQSRVSASQIANRNLQQPQAERQARRVDGWIPLVVFTTGTHCSEDQRHLCGARFLCDASITSSRV